MPWTPPSKFTVMITFLLCIFGLFIIYDWVFLFPDGLLSESDFKIGEFTVVETWMFIAMIVLFLSWFIMFLGVRLKGL